MAPLAHLRHCHIPRISHQTKNVGHTSLPASVASYVRMKRKNTKNISPPRTRTLAVSRYPLGAHAKVQDAHSLVRSTPALSLPTNQVSWSSTLKSRTRLSRRSESRRHDIASTKFVELFVSFVIGNDDMIAIHVIFYHNVVLACCISTSIPLPQQRWEYMRETANRSTSLA